MAENILARQREDIVRVYSRSRYPIKCRSDEMVTTMSIVQEAQEAKEIVAFIKKSKDKDIYELFLKIRKEVHRIRKENNALRKALKAASDASAATNQLIRDGDSYFLKSDTKREKPFCLTCWAFERKLVSLTVLQDQLGRHAKCDNCWARNRTISLNQGQSNMGLPQKP